jgi:glycine cleavage system H lipoate-binding protein
VLSRCGNGGFRYCELYLGMAHPGTAGTYEDATPVPDWLRYSANHLWVDATEDGACHIGIDAFLGRALGPIERITYVWLKGLHRPAAVFTVGGVDLEVVFPNPVLLTNCNLYARAEPSRITAQPYTGGWLFEGVVRPETTDGLLDAATANSRMEDEQRRMNDVLQRQQQTAADGGLPHAGILARLNREQRLELFHEFFSPFKAEI